MPSVSERQHRYLEAKFGHAWVKAHHFDVVKKKKPPKRKKPPSG